MSKTSVTVAFLCCLAGCNGSPGVAGSPGDAGLPRDDASGSGGAAGTGGTTTVAATGGRSAQGSGGAGTRVGTGGASEAGGSAGSGGASGMGGRLTGTTVASGGQVGGGGAPTTGGTVGPGGRFGSGGTTSVGGATGSAGSRGTGGRTGAGGAGSGGATGRGGATGSGGSTSTAIGCDTALPTPTGKTTVSATINVSGTKDYAMQQVCADPNALGPGDQSENQKPVFLLAANAVLKNVIIGGSGCSAADGVHCESGSCTLENVWWGDVGEDAATLKGSSASQVMTVTGGGAFSASDKVFQHNGPGTITISNFYVNNAGKLYRSCGNCSSQYTRNVVLDHVTAKATKYLVGINTNYNDTATFSNITICGGGTTICEKYTGNSTGAEPTTIGSGADGKNCIYSNSDITNL